MEINPRTRTPQVGGSHCSGESTANITSADYTGTIANILLQFLIRLLMARAA